MKSLIVTNQDSLAYWTNLDHPVDYITILFYIGALLSIANGVRLMLTEEESEESNDTEKHDEAPVDLTDATSE